MLSLKPFTRAKMPINLASAETEKSSYKLRLSYLTLNAVVFAITYTLSNAYAEKHAPLASVAMAWEREIPFLPWMILPYLSSGILFAVSFFWVRSQDQLRVLSQRLLLCSVVACLAFVLWPLQLSSVRPEMKSGWWAPFFAYLNFIDRPYNQLPSLHVAYSLVLWCALKYERPVLAQWLLGICLTVVGLSTLFVYQHHFWDVLAGLLMGGLSLRLVLPLAQWQRAKPSVALHYALAALGSIFLGIVTGFCSVGLYFALCFALVSCAYHRQKLGFLAKKNGQFPLLRWLLYAPYLFGYWLVWCCVRWRGRGVPVFRTCADKLLISRRLTHAEAMELPNDCSVIDLANELTELKILRAGRYHYFPMLDLTPITPECCVEIVALIDSEIAAGRTVLVHCAMGYARSVEIADAYLLSKAVPLNASK